MIKNEQAQTGDDEIDLKELFLSLWAYKLLIMVVSVFCVVSAGYYAINADKVYIAESTFALGDNDGSSGLLGALGPELGAFGALGGISGAGVSGAGALLERVVSREFILEVSDELDLLNDELFNPYNPDFQGKRRLSGDTARQATSPEVKELRSESLSLKGSRLIEVKTTNGWERTPFHISRNELAVADENRDIWSVFSKRDKSNPRFL